MKYIEITYQMTSVFAIDPEWPPDKDEDDDLIEASDLMINEIERDLRTGACWDIFQMEELNYTPWEFGHARVISRSDISAAETDIYRHALDQ